MLELTVTWARHGDDDCLRISGWAPAAWDRLRQMPPREVSRGILVYPTEAVANPDGRRVSVAESHLPPTAGRFVVNRDDVVFVPRFPFVDATSYTVLIDPALAAGDGHAVDVADFASFAIARPAVEHPRSTTVVGVSPNTATIPRNQLRLYVHFSAPMAEGVAGHWVHVRRADTRDALPDSFLSFDPELWDPARRRLTVFFDPARIKRGLAPHLDAGYPLAEGCDVELVIDPQFPDARGASLVAGHVQRYTVGPDVRALVDVDRWTVDTPAVGTRDPFRVHFDRALDRALLDRCLEVVDGSGNAVPGRVEIGAGDDSWALHPARKWTPVEHRLVVRTILEDLAGNSLSRVFDRDLARPDHDPREGGFVEVGFTPVS